MSKKKVRIPGNFEPVTHSTRRKEKPTARVITVPGGSGAGWKCDVCGRILEPGIQCVKIGKQIYCTKCVQSVSL